MRRRDDEPGSRGYDRFTDAVVIWAMILFGIPFLATIAAALIVLELTS
jgi:hypothetical protein